MSDNDKPGPSYRDAMRTARAAANSVERRCWSIVVALQKHAGAMAFPYFDETMSELWDGALGHDVGGDDFIASLVEIQEEEPEQPTMTPELVALNAAAAYAVQGIKADRVSEPAAWSFAFDAAQWEGVLSGLVMAARGPEAVNAAVNSRTWDVKEPERSDMLAELLYKTLEEAHASGQLRPTATRVLSQWLGAPPAGFTVTSTSISWLDVNSDKQTAGIPHLKDRIKRMTSKRR